MTVFFIVPIFLLFFLRLVIGFDVLKVLRKVESKLPRLEPEPMIVEAPLLGVIVRLEGLRALQASSIYFLDLE